MYEPELPLLLGIDGQSYTVEQFLFGVSAEAATTGKYIDLVQHTAKRDKGPQVTPPLKPVRTEGPQHGLAMFERLQFKTATANNGKRRATQQYFHLNVEVFARCSDNSIQRVAICKSLPVVVRGRSPGHYTDKGQRRVKSLPSSPSEDRSYSKSPPNIPDYGYPYSPYTTFSSYGSTPITEMPPPSAPHHPMMMMRQPQQQQHEGEPYNPAMSPAMAQYPPSGRYMPTHDGNTSSPELSSPDMHSNIMPRNGPNPADMDKANTYPGPRPPPLGLNIQINNDGWDRHRTNSTNSLSSSYVSSISSPPPSDDRMYQYGMVPTMNGSYAPPPQSSQKPGAIPYTPVEEDLPSMNRWQYRPEPSWSEHHPSEHRDGLVHPLQ